MKRLGLALLFAGLLSSQNCTRNSVVDGPGSGSETVIGFLVTPDGAPAANTNVSLLASDFNPIIDSPLPAASTVTTDSFGGYTFYAVETGEYNIFARHQIEQTCALITGVLINDDTTYIERDTVRQPGAIKVLLPLGPEMPQGFIYIPGTPLMAAIPVDGVAAIIDAVPPGVIPSVNYTNISATTLRVIRNNVEVRSGDTTVIALPQWRFSQKVYLNTSDTGAGVYANQVNVPLLLRLNAVNFDFSQAQGSGWDLRFTKSDGSPLHYEIERWDSIRQSAAVWVKLDTVYGNSSAQSITMLWGNPAAADASNSAAVFDTADGFQGVWHLDQPVGGLFIDATANHYDGTPYDIGATNLTEGPTGYAARFNGISSHIRVHGTADSKLNFPQNGVYAISAWVCADTIDSLNQIIATKGHEQYFLKLKTQSAWEFVEWNDGKGDDMSRAPAKEKVWTHVVGIRNGAEQLLFVNGELIDSTISLFPAALPRDQSSDFSIGAYLQYITHDVHDGYASFGGVLDEMRVMDTVPSRDWIRLCYMNQKLADAVISYK